MITRFVLTLSLLAFAFGCPPESSCPAVDAGITSDGGVEAPPLTHALCWAGEGFQRCGRVSCRDPFSGQVLVDQRGEPLEARCGDDGVPSCWGVMRPFEEPVVVELFAEGVEYVWCEERP